jgi:hypothetical protein
LRDWFAQFPYLSKLREPQILARAISAAVFRSDAKYAVADRYDEAKKEYVGLKLGRLVDVDLNSDILLVRAEVAQAQIAKNSHADASASGGLTVGDAPPQTPMSGQPPSTGAIPAPARRRRFYAKVTLDPNRPTPQVSNIAQSILSELDRVRGPKITLTLDIDAEAAGGFPEDVESVVRDNARDLQITDFGFEEVMRATAPRLFLARSRGVRPSGPKRYLRRASVRRLGRVRTRNSGPFRGPFSFYELETTFNTATYATRASPLQTSTGR